MNPNNILASHILVKTLEEAKEIKAKVDAGEDFAQLAKTYSKCPSARDGGSLGYFPRGRMVKSFEDAAFGTEVGKVSDPIETQFGFHLIKRLY